MYKEYFGLKELPFSIAPNPRYLYLTRQHQEALAHLVYGLKNGGGIILLTGEVGTGKTTISRKLLEDIPDHIDIAWIVNPKLSVEELLATICDELSINYPENNHSIKTFTDMISTRLIQAHGQGRNVVLMIDEAQNLSVEVLEQLRLLTNLETNEHKLLQIVLLGQPELKTMLERADLRQLAQRITARYHLHPLNRHETTAYIRHRLAVGGCTRPVFSTAAIKLAHRISHGTPRLINLLCDRAMLGVYSSNGGMVYPKHIRQSCKEVLGDAAVPKRAMLVPATIIALPVIAGIVFATGAWKNIPANFKPVVVLQSSSEPMKAPEQLAITTETTEKPKSAPITTGMPEETARLQGTIHAAEKAVALEAEKPIPTPKTDKSIVEPAKKILSDHQRGKLKSGTVVNIAAKPWDIIEKTGSKTVAFETLAEIWHTQIGPPTDNTICPELFDHKLSCLKQRTNLWVIITMNRPAIFHIIGSDSIPHYGVIRSISNGYARIQLQQQQWRITLSELKRKMQGEISLIWYKPPGFQKRIQQGDNGQAVAWLASQLDHIQGTMIPPGQAHVMDDLLVARLKDFQRSERMTPDGIAGILTLMRINERIGLKIPTLRQLAKH